jgi:hypothetical protein
MNSHRLPHELKTAPYNHYHQVIETSHYPIPPVATIYGTGPIVQVKPAPQPPERFVETLRARGIKVRVQHFRWVETFQGPELHRISKYGRKIDTKNLIPLHPIFQNGGETHVSVQLQDGREAKGVAVCNTTDLYNKRLGVWIAAKRALAVLKDEKPVLTVYPPS